MVDYDELLLTAALVKWAHSEPMSSADLERIMTMIQTRELNVDSAQPDEVAGLQQRFIDVIKSRFIPQN